MIVLEMGVWFPIGDYGHMPVENQLAESTLQVGRGAFGLQPGFYQTYEILPHRLNQFLSGTYRYTMRNSDGYRFGDEFALNAGLNLVTFPWLTLTNQINFRYKSKDNLEASLFEFRGAPFNRAVLLDGNVIDRDIPTTDSTLVAFSTGIVMNVFDFGQVYFIAQIPIYREFNGNLQQEIGFVGGVTKSFTTPSLASLFGSSRSDSAQQVFLRREDYGTAHPAEGICQIVPFHRSFVSSLLKILRESARRMILCFQAERRGHHARSISI